MHEASLVRNLVRHILDVAQENQATRVIRIVLKVGPLAHIDPPHLIDHFHNETKGTIAEGADVLVEETDELHELSVEAIEVLTNESPVEEDF